MNPESERGWGEVKGNGVAAGVIIRNRGGFTLVEVLVASVILAAGMIAVLQAFSVAVKGLDSVREVMVVSDRFDQTLGELELSSWPKREPPVSDGGTWMTPAGPMNWQLRSAALLSTTNSTLFSIVLEAAPVGGTGQYRVDTEWLDVRGRQ